MELVYDSPTRPQRHYSAPNTHLHSRSPSAEGVLSLQLAPTQEVASKRRWFRSRQAILLQVDLQSLNRRSRRGSANSALSIISIVVRCY